MARQGIKGKRLVVLLSLIVLLSFALMTINSKREEGPFFLESLVVWVFSPFQALFTHTVNSISGVFDHYVFVADSSQENERLKAHIDRLERRNNALIEKMKQHERVARLIGSGGSPALDAIPAPAPAGPAAEAAGDPARESGLADEPLASPAAAENGFAEQPLAPPPPAEAAAAEPDAFVVATVIGRDATQWSKVVILNKGTRDGVRPNLAVVTDAGVIGHVIQASGGTSKVLLVTDGRSAVDSLFQESRVSGVVVGTGEDHGEMKYVPKEAEVHVGDKVLSSGLGGTFPKGLRIGVVTHVTKKKQGLFQDILIAPSADLTRLEEVLVLLS